jgi:hypothetical protein
MTSGIAAVMTLPCSGLPEKSLDRQTALYSPLSFFIDTRNCRFCQGGKCGFAQKSNREKANRENPQIFPVGKL